MNKKVLQVTVQEPKIKTIKLLGQDVQVKDYIPYEEKREMVEKIVYGGYYSNSDLGVSGTLPIYPAVKFYYMVQYYTDAEIPIEQAEEAYSQCCKNGEEAELYACIKDDLEVVDMMLIDIGMIIELETEARASAGYVLREFLSPILNLDKTTETLSRSEAMNTALLDLLDKAKVYDAEHGTDMAGMLTPNKKTTFINFAKKDV